MNVENQITLDQFKPRFYQSIILDAWENKGYRKILYVLGRRSGKDYLAWNMAIRQCLKKTCLVLYCLPTYNQCRKVIFDAIAIDGTRFLDLIPSDLVANINATEQKITFNNGSILRLIGADSYNTSLVGTNAQMIILSEASLMQLESVYAYARPILAANGGTILVFGCVAPNTLVIGSNGLRRIKDVSPSREEYSPYGKKIYGLGGFHVAEDFYYGGIQKTRKITLSSGYQLEATCIHPVWNGTAWVKTEDLKIGDLIPIQYGQNVWGKGLDYTEIATRAYGRNGFTKPYREDDFFYLLGLIHADGCYDKYKVTVTKKKDQSIIDFLEHQGFRTGKDGIHHNLNSVNFCSFLEGLDFKHGAKNKTFPEKFFDCSRKQMRAFLQGLFDGDGTSNKCPSHYGSIKLTSTCLEFIRDLQIILLNFGIVSSIRREEKGPSVKVKVSSTIYNLEITGYFAHIFYETIGFRLRRKQANHEFISEGNKEESGNVYPVDVEKLFGYRFGKNRIK